MAFLQSHWESITNYTAVPINFNNSAKLSTVATTVVSSFFTLENISALLVLTLTLITIQSIRINASLRDIPVYGHSGLLTSYISAIRFFTHGDEILREGYNKHKPHAFRVAQLTRWLVIITGEEHINDLRISAEKDLSFVQAVKELIASDYTICPEVTDNAYHIPLIRSKLTGSLNAMFPDIYDEIVQALEANVPISEDWTKIKALDTMLKVVARVSNRVFVGAPLCQEPEFVKLNIDFTIRVVVGSKIINLFPSFLKPIAGRLFTKVPSSVAKGVKSLTPIIQERQNKLREYGIEYSDKPNDMLSWLIDSAQKQISKEQSIHMLTLRILTLNIGAVHASAMSLTQLLYTLASYPIYFPEIRQEIETAVNEEGWTKNAISRMTKLDSFIREDQRVNGQAALVLSRKAINAYTFTDGTRIPKGTYLAAPTRSRHFDEDLYPDAATFKPFRFEKKEAKTEGDQTNEWTSASAEYLAFGFGKHACPGRFFASLELKTILAYILLTYDIKLSPDLVSGPQPFWFADVCVPDPKGHLLFRKRREV